MHPVRPTLVMLQRGLDGMDVTAFSSSRKRMSRRRRFYLAVEHGHIPCTLTACLIKLRTVSLIVGAIRSLGQWLTDHQHVGTGGSQDPCTRPKTGVCCGRVQAQGPEPRAQKGLLACRGSALSRPTSRAEVLPT